MCLYLLCHDDLYMFLFPNAFLYVLFPKCIPKQSVDLLLKASLRTESVSLKISLRGEFVSLKNSTRASPHLHFEPG